MALGQSGVKLDGRLVRVAVIAAATWSRPAAVPARGLAEQLADVMGLARGSERRLSALWEVLRDTATDEVALYQLQIHAIRFEALCRWRMSVRNLMLISDPDMTGDNRTYVMDAFADAYNVAEERRA